jgi:hypothetical protein
LRVETLVFPIISGYVPVANVRFGDVKVGSGSGWDKKVLVARFI